MNLLIQLPMRHKKKYHEGGVALQTSYLGTNRDRQIYILIRFFYSYRLNILKNIALS